MTIRPGGRILGALAVAVAAFAVGSRLDPAAALERHGSIAPAVVDVPLHIEPDVAGFADFVVSTLNDPRSWSQAGFRFRSDPSSRYRVILAEPAAVDRLCAPLRTHGDLSCQNENVVALNAERWRDATADWDRSLKEYRQYMVNHEVGHLIGQRHPQPRCPTKGTPSAVMEQQTKGLEGCTGNAWPLAWEIERATARPVVLAPAPDWNPSPVPRNLGGAASGPVTTSIPAATTLSTPSTLPTTSTTSTVVTRIGASAPTSPGTGARAETAPSGIAPSAEGTSTMLPAALVAVGALLIGVPLALARRRPRGANQSST